MHTFTKWLAAKITADIQAREAGADAGAGASGRSRVLVTGGGANNDYLLKLLNLPRGGPAGHDFIVPSKQVADFKEAALVALCALLRVEGRPNALPSATGAARPTVNGALYLPPPQ